MTAPFLYSPDGGWWWDGYHWRPLPMPTHKEPLTRSGNWSLGLGLGAVPALVVPPAAVVLAVVAGVIGWRARRTRQWSEALIGPARAPDDLGRAGRGGRDRGGADDGEGGGGGLPGGAWADVPRRGEAQAGATSGRAGRRPPGIARRAQVEPLSAARYWGREWTAPARVRGGRRRGGKTVEKAGERPWGRTAPEGAGGAQAEPFRHRPVES